MGDPDSDAEAVAGDILGPRPSAGRLGQQSDSRSKLSTVGFIAMDDVPSTAGKLRANCARQFPARAPALSSARMRPYAGTRPGEAHVLVLLTQRSTYLLDVDLQLLLQVPGGTDCTIGQGVWHRVLIDRLPRTGEALFCSVLTAGGAAVGLRTTPLRWIGPPAAVPALIAASLDDDRRGRWSGQGAPA